MPAQALTSPTFENLGSVNVVFATATTVSTGDTSTSPLSNPLFAVAQPTTGTAVVNCVISGSTITYNISSGTPTLKVMIIGRG